MKLLWIRQDILSCQSEQNILYNYAVVNKDMKICNIYYTSQIWYLPYGKDIDTTNSNLLRYNESMANLESRADYRNVL